MLCISLGLHYLCHSKTTRIIQTLKRIILIAFAICGTWIAMYGQPVCNVFFYDEEDGLPHGHATQLLQDRHGFLWFSTWNGLCRYDGYAFQTFKPSVGDGCHMATDRIRDISLLPDGNILCKVDDDHYLFDSNTYSFRDLTTEQSKKAASQMQTHRQSHSLAKGGQINWKDSYGTNWTLDHESNLTYISGSGETIRYPLLSPIPNPSFALSDHQGNLWVLSANGIYKLSTSKKHIQLLPQEHDTQTKCLFTDKKKRIWVTTKEDMTVRLYSHDGNHLIGYLDSNGQLHQSFHSFGHSIYCIHESSDGTIWMGSKPDGLFRLHEKAVNQFDCDHITTLPDNNVYSITDDKQGRLWIATLGGGVCVCENPQAALPSFRIPSGYPKDGTSQRVRYLHITKNGFLLSAATDGLIVAKLKDDADKMLFRRHYREPERANSLSSSATMDILEDDHGRIYVSTESGGINMIESSDLGSEHLVFRHINVSNHQLPSDVTLSLTNMGNGDIMVVGNHYIGLIDNAGHVRVLDAHFFNDEYRFSDAHPQQLDNGKWLFGLNKGAFTITAAEMQKNTHQLQVVLTGATIQGEPGHWGAESHDTLTLSPKERSITVHFAAIDYNSPERINYAFRLITDNKSDTIWNPIGHDRSVTLLDLNPGSYLLEIRSTDTEGEWLNNIRRLTIKVEPKFWESALGKLTALLLFLGFFVIVAYTLYYIHRLKRQQHETLEAYLALLNTPSAPSPQESAAKTTQQADSLPPNTHITPEDDAMMKRLMSFIEENIDNSDLRIADLASAAATSPSGLQRKVKQAMGITPQDLLREARIKHACLLLDTTDKTISEVAYSCGFSDPKYFSRCFKTSMGKSPTEYKTGDL